jgi:hypothetical protein
VVHARLVWLALSDLEASFLLKKTIDFFVDTFVMFVLK